MSRIRLLIIIAIVFSASIFLIVYLMRMNNPPFPPELKQPHNGAVDVKIDTILFWEAYDPDGDKLSYDLYISNDKTDLKKVASNIQDNKYQVSLDYNTTYFWKVVVKDSKGAQNESEVWSFTTENAFPSKPYNPYPPPESTNMPLNVTLAWQAEDPDGDILRYDIYFGTSPDNLEKIKRNYEKTSLEITDLKENTRYYWRIVVKDAHNGLTEGDLWWFETKKAIIPKVELIEPVNTKLNSNQVVFKWSFPLKDANFDILIGTSKDNLKAYIESIQATSEVVKLDFGQKYYWKVIAEVNDKSYESKIESFEIVEKKPVEKVKQEKIIKKEIKKEPTKKAANNFMILAGGGTGINILSFLSPVKFEVLSRILTEGGAINIFFKNNRVYVADWDNGFVIIDITHPKAPKIVSKYSTFAKAFNIFVENETAYVIEEDGGIEILDISDVKNPRYIGYLKVQGSSGAIFVKNKKLFVSAGYDGIVVFDISDPKVPNQLDYYDVHGYLSDFTIVNDFIFLLDEQEGLVILDGRNPSKLRRISNIYIDGDNYRIKFYDNKLFISRGYKGLIVVDVKSKWKPSIINEIVTGGFVYDLDIKDDYLYIIDNSKGLMIYNISNIKKPQLMKIIPSYRSRNIKIIELSQ